MVREIVRGVLGGLGWMSCLPTGRSANDLETFSSNGYVFPIVGGVLGLILGCVVLILSYLPLEASIKAVGYIFSIYLLQGINHSDGLADFGDAVAAHGSCEDRHDAMKDLNTGIGGVLTVVVFVMALYAVSEYLFALPRANIGLIPILPLAVLIVFASEVCAKTCISLEICLGSSSHEGHGSRHIESTPRWHVFPSIIILTLSVLPLGEVGFVMLITSVVSTFVVMGVSNSVLGGVSGDVFGATNEVVRVVSLGSGVIASALL